jgi:DNA-nicking Smr family endonuclease
LAPEATLDLHGLRQHEAHDAVDAFVQNAVQEGMRMIRIITGKGEVLRDALPRWLESPLHHRHVLSLQHAKPNEGGTGVFLILLRTKNPIAEHTDEY